MKHYALLKLAPGSDIEAVEEKIWKTFENLDKELTWLNHPAIYRNCMNQDTNADIMIVIDLDDEENLQSYLNHPLHIKMTEDLKNAITGWTVFDHY